MKLRHSARTDVGKTRDHNEDSYGVGDDEQVDQMGELLVICDGMGGHAAGEVASQLAVQAILSSYYDDTSEDRRQALEQAFEQANAQVFARGHGSMGTTGVAALLHHDALHIANVGDSRAYLIRDGQIRQISHDHSFVGDQVRAGLITPDQARLSPHRNVITRALGYQAEVTVDLFRWPLQIDDVIVLSSDGMHGLVTDDEIVDIVGRSDPDEATSQLIKLANSRGGTDNITVVVVHVEALDWYGHTASTPLDELRERVTIPLPSSELDVVENPAVDAPAAVTAPEAAQMTPPPAPILPPKPTAAERPPPAQPTLTARQPAEPRLSMRGALLSVLLLVVLGALIVMALNPSWPLVFGGETAPSATPAPVFQTTAAPPTIAQPTAAPTLQPTAAPTALPTTVPALQPTAAPPTIAPPTTMPTLRPTVS
jgi:PPM family protein phosphatase